MQDLPEPGQSMTLTQQSVYTEIAAIVSITDVSQMNVMTTKNFTVDVSRVQCLTWHIIGHLEGKGHALDMAPLSERTSLQNCRLVHIDVSSMPILHRGYVLSINKVIGDTFVSPILFWLEIMIKLRILLGSV